MLKKMLKYFVSCFICFSLVFSIAIVVQLSTGSNLAYAQAKNACPDCGKSLTYISDYKRWYCESEGKYMDEGYDPAKVVKKLPPPPPAPAKKLPPPPPAVKKLPPPPPAAAQAVKLPPPPIATPSRNVPPPPTASAPRASSGAGTLVFGFDELSDFSGSEESSQNIELSGDYATEGTACFKITFESGTYPGFEIYPSGFLVQDFAGYNSLLVDIYNPGPDMKVLGMLIDNDARDRFTLDEQMIKRGPSTIKVDLRRAIGKLKNNLRPGTMVFFIEPDLDASIKLPIVLYFDNLRLQ